MTFHVPEKYRVTEGKLKSSLLFGNNGAFIIPQLTGGPDLRTIASDGDQWEHVSVSLEDRIPTWEEMCYIKSIFWDENDRVVQFHPPRSEYVNKHPNCLHLWRHVALEFPHPPKYLLG